MVAAPGIRTMKKNRREDVTNFEVSHRTTTTVSDGYAVKKLFIAVLVNRSKLADAGDKTNQAVIDSKIAEINQLAATAGGLDHSRGDQIQVTAVDFAEGSRD